MAKTPFLSYARADAEFARRLACDLKARGCPVWIDQIDSVPGHRWDQTIEAALADAPTVLVVLSPSSVQSQNVQDEAGFAIDEGKTITPILTVDCKIPLRLRRWQYIDFRDDYEEGLARLVARLATDDAVKEPGGPDEGVAAAAADGPAALRRFPVSASLATGGLILAVLGAMAYRSLHEPTPETVRTARTKPPTIGSTEAGTSPHAAAANPAPGTSSTSPAIAASKTQARAPVDDGTAPGPLRRLPQAAAPAVEASNATRVLAGTLKKVRSSGTITLGVRQSSIPFSYLGGDRRAIGYSVDLCMRIVDAIRVDLKMASLQVIERTVVSSTRIPSIINGTIDLECGGTVNNAERQQFVSFTHTTFVASNRLLSKRASGIATLEDLRGKTLVSIAGTSNLQQVTQLDRERRLGIRIVSASDHGQAFHMVETGTADALAMDDILLHTLAAGSTTPDLYAISALALSYEPLAIMLRKDDPQFQALADRAVATIFRSGEIDGIYTKWFVSPIPPNGLTIGMPMSDALKMAIARPTHSSDPAAYR